LTGYGKEAGEPKFMLGDRDEFMGECPFILMPPKLSSKSEDGDCPPHWGCAADSLEASTEPEKGDCSLRPKEKKGDAGA
jgi:hypothetical protein